MNRSVWALVGVAFLMGCVTAQVLRVAPAAAQGFAGSRFEYVCQHLPHNPQGATAALNQFGAQGWELVTYVPASGYCFKRPLS